MEIERKILQAQSIFRCDLCRRYGITGCEYYSFEEIISMLNEQIDSKNDLMCCVDSYPELETSRVEAIAILGQ